MHATILKHIFLPWSRRIPCLAFKLQYELYRSFRMLQNVPKTYCQLWSSLFYVCGYSIVGKERVVNVINMRLQGISEGREKVNPHILVFQNTRRSCIWHSGESRICTALILILTLVIMVQWWKNTDCYTILQDVLYKMEEQMKVHI